MNVRLIKLDPLDEKQAIVEVEPCTQVSTLKLLVEVELQIPVQFQSLTINELNSDEPGIDSLSLAELGVVDGNPILCFDKRSISREANPRPEALPSTDLSRMFGRTQVRPFVDPLSVQTQNLLLEKVKRDQVNQNLQAAQEYMPEAFGEIVMLYIRIEINSHPIKAFVDSGAQTTIMSSDCAQRCGIERLIDTRFTGVAKGVGVANVVGRIHLTQMKCNEIFVPVSFTILDGQPMDVLMGLG